MLKRPKPNESEQDILRMQQEFLAEKAKNPKLQPAAKIVKMEKASKKSLFAQTRERQRTNVTATPEVGETLPDETTNLILGEIHEKIVGDIARGGSQQQQNVIPNIILGDIVENYYTKPKISSDSSATSSALPFPKVGKLPLKLSDIKPGKSIFAMSMQSSESPCLDKNSDVIPMDCEASTSKRDLTAMYGGSSAIINDVQTAIDVHKTNLDILSGMSETEILAERQKLLNTLDPALVALLTKKRNPKEVSKPISATVSQPASKDIQLSEEILTSLSESNPAIDILQKSETENWINFDVIEKDKLEWMQDIPLKAAKLKPGEKFEARFDWKGVLLPYSTENMSEKSSAPLKDERELYLHGSEPQRPGYTLQELFRLARSNVVQQRVSAFGAIAGILNIYNQGFYDKVLELPITKIFFLLRFGLDDNTPAMLEVVSKALAVLCYNETDETLLDFIYDNPNCQWQPILQVVQTNSNDNNYDDPTSIENLQKQMQQLEMNSNMKRANIRANIDETETESKMSMSDFQLAETDLIDCLLRTNILQRIYFILNTIRAENSTVTSCLKLLIRLARYSKNTALEMVKNYDLMDCLFENFLPGLERVDTMKRIPPMYNYPQHLCLKLFRVLISQDMGIAIKFVNMKLIDKLQNYLFCADDIRGKLIKVQIESLRILRCLLLLRVDNFLYRRFLPAFRFMLEWHFNYNVYEAENSHLIRQHAASILAAISNFPAGSGNTLEISSKLGELLHNCCCSWFHQAKRHGIKDFSQASLLSISLHTITCYIHYCGTTANSDASRFRNLIEKYLRDFITSEVFAKFISSLSKSTSIILHQTHDRRNVHPPLPNVGAIIMHHYGPQLIITQTYPVHLLNALWRLLELIEKTAELHSLKSILLDVIIQPQIIEPLVAYLRDIATQLNLYLATNFFAKTELQLIYKLLCFEGIAIYFSKAELIQIAYNFICCLTAEHGTEIEYLLERYIFNSENIKVNEESLNKWRMSCMELIYPHYIVLNPNELTLSMPYTQLPILPRDWPYFQLKYILQNYIDNVQQQKTAALFSEREVLQMTFTFVSQLETCNPNLEIVTPTEKLMYFMIAFMGSESQFLDAQMRPLLEEQLCNFYEKCKEYKFQFDASYEGKCKFENLYALFVDHFQAASYGDELFSSLVMIPLAQKYDNKWRRRIWSDYAAALCFLNCNEKWLIGGLLAYLEPIEEDKSLIHSYDMALRTNLLRIDSLPHKIATYHVQKFKEKKMDMK